MLNSIYRSFLFKPLYLISRKLFKAAEFFISYKYESADRPTVSLKTIRAYNKNRLLGPKKIICNAPFNHMYFKQDGNVTACCASSIDAYGNIRVQSLFEIWEGENANQLRHRIKNYNLGGGCAGCQYSLESGNYNAFIGRIYDTLLPSVPKKYPTEITFEISNTCNLECIMCTGEFSNLIRKNIEKLPDIPNYYDERFFEQIKEFLPHLKRVRFMGGEPFLIKQYAPIMEFLVQENPDCKIHIQTNGTILNSAVKKIVESKNVEISISIDSLIKENYNTIRVNGNFERTMQNISYFSQRAKKYNQLININFCVMQNNWEEVPEIVHFCEKNNFTLNLIPVEYPRNLSLRIYNTNYLKKILSYFENNTTKQNNIRLQSVYEDYIKYLHFLINQSVLNAEKRIKLLSYDFGQLFIKSKELFLLLNRIDSSSKNATIFDDAFEDLNNLTETDKMYILCNLILDSEQILNDKMFDNREQTINEIKSKLKRLFILFKEELPTSNY